MGGELQDSQGFKYNRGLGGIQPVIGPGGQHQRGNSQLTDTSSAPSGYAVDGTPVYQVRDEIVAPTTEEVDSILSVMSWLGVLIVSVALAPVLLLVVLVYVGLSIAIDRLYKARHTQAPAPQSIPRPEFESESILADYGIRTRRILASVWKRYRRFWSENFFRDTG